MVLRSFKSGTVVSLQACCTVLQAGRGNLQSLCRIAAFITSINSAARRLLWHSAAHKRNQDCKPSCPCERVIPLGHACQKSPCSRHESRLQTVPIPRGKMIWYEEFCKIVCTLVIQTMWVGPCAGRSTWPAVSAGARRCKRGRSLLLLLLLPRLCVWVHVHRGDGQASPFVAHNIQCAVWKSRRQHAKCRQLVHTQERHSTTEQARHKQQQKVNTCHLSMSMTLCAELHKRCNVPWSNGQHEQPTKSTHLAASGSRANTCESSPIVCTASTASAACWSRASVEE